MRPKHVKIQYNCVIDKFCTLMVELSVEIGLHFKNILKLQNNIEVGLKATLIE